jgi:heptaprenylglyceryl phosphate synthase
MSRFYALLSQQKGFAVLVDPDKQEEQQLDRLVATFEESPPDVILVGGSLVFRPVDDTITYLKKHTELPIYLFPGAFRSGRTTWRWPRPWPARCSD